MSPALAVVVSCAVGVVVCALGWLTPAASFITSVMGFVVISRLGWFWTLPPLIFLAVGSLLSGGKRGRRNAFQILANGGVATLFAALGRPEVYLVALTVGFADTVATEVGTRLSPHAYLITGLKRVPSGTSGAISLPGTVAGLTTVLFMSVFLVIGGGNLPLFLLSSTLGLFVDSLLGATLESRRLFNNDMTNFTATLLSSLLYASLQP